MNTEVISTEEALHRGLTLPWAFLRCYSTAYLGPTPEQVEQEELLEARFFSETEEIRLLRIEGELQSLRRTDGEEQMIDSSYRIANPRFGRIIRTRRDIVFDEDGQAAFTEPRLCGWEGGKDDA